MDEIELRKKGTGGAPDEELTVWTEDNTLYWMRVARLPNSVTRKEGDEELDSEEKAEEAAQAKIAEAEKEGFVRLGGAPPPATEPPSQAKSAPAKPAWFNSLPKALVAQHDKLEKTAQTKGLGHRFVEIEALMRPGIELVLKRARPADLESGVVSRVGGEPDLPPTQPWPSYDGTALTFVGQIVLSDEITEHDLEGLLPKEGVLSFFAQLDPEAPDYGDRCAVLYFPTSKNLVRTAPPAPDRVLAKAGVLTPKARLTVAPSLEPEVERLGLNRAEQKAYHDDLFLGPIPEGRHHLLLGWPNAATYHANKGRRFLAQFDSDHHLDFQMGDYDTLRFYVDGEVVAASTLKTAVCTLSEA